MYVKATCSLSMDFFNINKAHNLIISIFILTSFIWKFENPLSRRISGILLQPIVPNLATKLLDKMNIELEERQWKFAQPGLGSGERKLSETPTILYQKLR